MILVKSEEDYKFFKQTLEAYKKVESEEYYQRHIKIINTNYHVICMSMDKIRFLAKEILKGEPLEFLKFASLESYEEVLIQGIVIAGIKDLNLQLKYFDSYIKKIDSWAICDSVCSSMKLLKNSKEKRKYFDYFIKLCYKSAEFEARFGIITLLSCYLEKEYLGKILTMIETVSSDKYYIQMALAWLISVLFVKFREDTLELLEKRKLNTYVQNKAIQKCRESFRVSKEDKELLLKYKK